MTLEQSIGYCLASQEIREKARTGKIIIPNFDERKIQPSSFEPTIGDSVYILDTQAEGLFRPELGSTIEDLVATIPKRRRLQKDISSGHEVKRGFSYLFRLQERMILEENELVRSSPKSSAGRTFLNVRSMMDYTPSYDETHRSYVGEQEIGLWLLVQPMAFNAIIHPGLSLNQLRFIHGDARLGTVEIREQCEKEMMIRAYEGQELVRAAPTITDTIHLHLDLEGEQSEGVVGWRARHNPEPIDLSRVHEYDVFDYFEPLMKQKNGKNNPAKLKPGELYIVASKEILYVPPTLNVEMEAYSQIGFAGMVHFAGFFDNGWLGKIVGEIRSDEATAMTIKNGMPLSKLRLFRTRVPDKLYGAQGTGSNYYAQTGPRVSKNFKPIDFATVVQRAE